MGALKSRALGSIPVDFLSVIVSELKTGARGKHVRLGVCVVITRAVPCHRTLLTFILCC